MDLERKRQGLRYKRAGTTSWNSNPAMFSSVAIVALSAVSLATAATAATVPPVVVGSHTSLGCFPDSSVARVLRGASFSDANSFRLEDCTAFCSERGFQYVGIEYGRECYCDWMMHNDVVRAPDGDCNTICSGIDDTYCGGPNRIQIFARDPAFTAPVAKSGANGYKLLGCYTDKVSSRALTRPAPISGGVTVEKCTAACQRFGYSHAGVEFGDECFCGNSIQSSGQLTAANECYMRCSGDTAELCGAPDRIHIYGQPEECD